MDNTSDKRRSRQTLARPVMADSRNDDAAIGIQTVSENGLEYDRKTFSYESEKGSAFRWADEHPGAAVNPPDGGIVSADAGYDDASADVHGMIEDIIKENERKAKSNKKKNKKVSNDQKGSVRSAKVKRAGSGTTVPVKVKSGTGGSAAAAKSGQTKSSGSAKTQKARKPQKPEKPAKQKKTKKPKKPKKKVGIIRKFFRLLLVVIIFGGLAGGGYVAYTVSHAPEIHPDRIYNTLDVTTHIYDDKGKMFDEVYYSENRQIVDYEELPEDLKNAFIAVEDKTFWTHKGFNFRRIIGAIIEGLHGGRISGTSTITQQLARNVFLPEDKSIRSVKRKIIEMYYAYQIEQTLSKEEILAAYLNTIYLGYGCYGVDTAARKYFSKSVDELDLEECAALAALPQAPGLYSLIVSEKGEDNVKIRRGVYANDASRDRRYMILDMMAEQGYITEKEAKKAKRPIEEYLDPSKESAASKSAFKDYLIQTVMADLVTKYNITEDEASRMIYSRGLNIYSTMNTKAQKVIAKEFSDDSNFPATVKDGTEVESAMVITEVGTGKVKAMVGTRFPEGQKLFNRATNPRQPGSSIKPLTVYSAALQKSYECQQKGKTFPFVNKGYDRQGSKGWGKYITVSSTVIDEKMTVNGQTWPLNYSRTYTGWNNFRTALQKSINTCAVKILVQVGTEYSMDLLKKFGVTSAIDDTSEPYNDLNLAALGLGAMTEGISPLEMSVAFAVFPNAGVRNTPVCYTRVEDRNGNVLLEGESETVRVLDEGVAWIMTNALQSVISQGIAYDARVEGVAAGGKTGTTNDVYDIWFNGFTPSYSASLWIGTDQNVEMITDSTTAAKLWGRIMNQLQRAKEGSYPMIPSNIVVKNGQYYTYGTEPDDPPPKKTSKKSSKNSSSNKKKND